MKIFWFGIGKKSLSLLQLQHLYFLSKCYKSEECFYTGCKDTLPLAQSIYSFEVNLNVWNKEFFASLRKYLQACKQFLNEPHAASLKEGKNPGQSRKLSNVIHKYVRNF